MNKTTNTKILLQNLLDLSNKQIKDILFKFALLITIA